MKIFFSVNHSDIQILFAMEYFEGILLFAMSRVVIVESMEIVIIINEGPREIL